MKYSKDKEDKAIQNIKDILEKEHGREFTWDEATEGLGSIKMLAKIVCEIAMEDSRRKELLKENPEGYHLRNGGICEVCYDHYSDKNTWYDKHGLKCINCQKAINDKVIQKHNLKYTSILKRMI
jgi:hypothetical protein